MSEMIHCYWLAHQKQCKSEEKERETLSVIWVSHHQQCFHLCGAEGLRFGLRLAFYPVSQPATLYYHTRLILSSSVLLLEVGLKYHAAVLAEK